MTDRPAEEHARTPEVDAPEVDAPEVDAPEAEVPEAEVPEAEVPEAEVPEAEVPEAEVPEAEVPEPRGATWGAGLRFSVVVGLAVAGLAGVLLSGPSLRPGDSGWVLSLADWGEVLPLAAQFFVGGAGVAGLSYVLSARRRRRQPRAALESWLNAGEVLLARGPCGAVRGEWFDPGWLYLTDRRLRAVCPSLWDAEQDCSWSLTEVAHVTGAEGSELLARLGVVSGHLELRLTSGDDARISGVSPAFWLDRIQDARAAAVELEAARAEAEAARAELEASDDAETPATEDAV